MFTCLGKKNKNNVVVYFIFIFRIKIIVLFIFGVALLRLVSIHEKNGNEKCQLIDK